MHGGVKFYRGSAAAARSYVEADHSRADDFGRYGWLCMVVVASSMLAFLD